MAANDKIIVSSQNRQEQSGLNNLRLYLTPWRCTLVDQRDDFGRDGFVQVVDNDEVNHFISPLSFSIQCKSSSKALTIVESDSVETRHLSLWTQPQSSPLFLIMWSAVTNEFRFRSARSVREELSRTNPSWETQSEVTVHYRKHDGYQSSADAHASLKRQLTDEVDIRGGIETYHATTRRIVLTQVFMPGTMTTSQRVELSSGQSILVGEGWIQGDITHYEVAGQHILASSFLLFEQVWAPIASIPVFLRLLGDNLTFDLLERERLRLYATRDSFGFLADKGAFTGQISDFTVGDPDRIEAMVQGIVGTRVDSKTLRKLRTYVTTPEEVKASTIVAYTKEDLKRTNLRELLGLRPMITEQEPIWDAPLINRLASVNFARALGTYLRADVVQYEGGLSRLASEKDYDLFGLSRLFDSVQAFDAVLRVAGIPDLGQLVNQLPLRDIVLLSDTTNAEDFRDWFWASAASLVGDGSNITTEFLRQVSSLVQQSLQAKAFPIRLKLRYSESIAKGILQGQLPSGTEPAFATTAVDGNEIIGRQRSNFSKHRKVQIGTIAGVSNPYSLCPCGSGQKLRFCCGRTL